VSRLQAARETRLGTLRALRNLEEIAASPVLIRLELPDRPGSLAIVAGVLAGCGVNILRLEVVGQGDGNAVDEFLLEGGDLQLALFRLGPYVRVIERAGNTALPDPGVAMAEACARIAAALSPERATEEFLHSALALVRADDGVFFERYRDDWLSPVAATVTGLGPAHVSELPHARAALETKRAIGIEIGDSWAPPRYAEHLPGEAAALIPVGSSPRALVAVVRASATPFASAELDRLESLAQYTHGVLRLFEDGSRGARADGDGG
jgi:hypothetical protein